MRGYLNQRFFFLTSANFSARLNCFTRYSRDSAEDLSFTRTLHTISTGPRERVYRAPFPALCASTRLGKSLVHPV